MAKEEHAIVEGLMGDSQSPYPMCSSATSSTTLSQTTEDPSHEDLSSPRSSYLGHTRLQDQPCTHTASQSASPELKPLSLTPDGTIGPPRYTDAIGDDDRTARRWPPPAPAIASASSTQTSSQRYKPKSVTFSRPSIAFELAGYKPEDGPSPLLADQATAQRVYRGIKQHISDQRKSHTGTDGHLHCTRAASAAKRQQSRTSSCVKLAALNAEAAQDLRAAELALGISPGKGKGKGGRGLARDRSKPMFDNSAWQTSPNGPAHGHAQRSPLRTGYQSRGGVETASVQRRHGQREGKGEGREGRSRSCVSSIESVCGSQSSPRPTQMQIPKPKPKPKPTGYYDYARPRRSNVAVLTISS